MLRVYCRVKDIYKFSVEKNYFAANEQRIPNVQISVSKKIKL